MATMRHASVHPCVCTTSLKDATTPAAQQDGHTLPSLFCFICGISRNCPTTDSSGSAQSLPE
eukprot:402220-Alexandrium_andersonii.AAC.1